MKSKIAKKIVKWQPFLRNSDHGHYKVRDIGIKYIGLDRIINWNIEINFILIRKSYF